VSLQLSEAGQGRLRGVEGMAILDTDFHNTSAGRYVEYLPERWRQFVRTTGVRNGNLFGATAQQRPFACRLDAVPPSGGLPGSDPAFAREQLLDEYGLSYAVINNIEPLNSGNAPVDFEIAAARAVNDFNEQEWLSSDHRWLASICVAADQPEAAAEEIDRCAARSDRFVQVIVGSRGERPYGNPKYLPLFEAAARNNLPVAFHTASNRHNHWTGVGPTEYYYEIHSLFPLAAQSMVASMIFEGVFERIPSLRIVCIELGWEWAVPLAWRLDASWRVLRDEVPHLTRKPSEYLRDNFWFSTQPGVEPEDPADFYAVFDQLEQFGLSSHLLFATDYPHWDMDSPFEALPPLLSQEAKEMILGRNAADLWRIDLADPTGGSA
jgi:uncharacterized protein